MKRLGFAAVGAILLGSCASVQLPPPEPVRPVPPTAKPMPPNVSSIYRYCVDRSVKKYPVLRARTNRAPTCKFDHELDQIVCGIGLTDENASARTAELSECIRQRNG